MIILGITSKQSNILKRLKRGETHFEISVCMNTTVHEVMLEEMRGKAKLSKRWKRSDVEVMKLLSITSLIIFSLMPMFYDMDMVRTAKARTTQSRNSKSKGKKDFEFIEV